MTKINIMACSNAIEHATLQYNFIYIETLHLSYKLFTRTIIIHFNNVYSLFWMNKPLPINIVASHLNLICAGLHILNLRYSLDKCHYSF